MPNDLPASDYPVRLKIDYPNRELNRTTTFFRIFLVIPISIVLALVSGGSWAKQIPPQYFGTSLPFISGGFLFFPILLVLLFQRKYPRWWFDWNLQLLRFETRVGAYLLLLTDVYPSAEDAQSVHLQITYPDAEKELSRTLPLVKWFLAIPHYVVLVALGLIAFFATFLAWFAILFEGRYPKSLFEFVVGVIRWGIRVRAYAFLLVTDRYPPFTLD